MARGRRGIDRDLERGVEARRAEHAQAVLGETRRGVAHRAQQMCTRSARAVEGIDQAILERIVGDGVDGEIAARQIGDDVVDEVD